MDSQQANQSAASAPTRAEIESFILGLFNKGHDRTFIADSPYRHTGRCDTHRLISEISDRFSLRRFDLWRCLDRNQYYGRLGRHEREFHERFPVGCTSSAAFQFEDLFCLIEELIRIARVQDESRLALSTLNDLEPGLGDKIGKLIDNYYRDSATYWDLQRSEKEISALLAVHGLKPDDIIVDCGHAKDMPLGQNFQEVAAAFQFADQFDA